MRLCAPSIAAVCVLAAGCVPTLEQTGVPTDPPGVQAISLFGDSLVPPMGDDETRAAQMDQLKAAWDDYASDTENADAAIWYGRRLAYLGYYREAIKAFTDALARYPDDARLYRHRGHRYITTRRFREALEDFSVAAKLTQNRPDEVEPDGQPNARNIPTGTLQSNIWYHMGLAHYVRGDFPRALSAYQECLKVSHNPDMLVATTYWLHMTLRRLGDNAEASAVLAPITGNLDVIENTSYHRLLLMYKGEVSADSILLALDREDMITNVTLGYGLGTWHYINGRAAEAEAVWRRVLEAPQWAGFGYIAAESEIERLGGR